MSALRVYGPDGKPEWRQADDGAVGRVSFSRRGYRDTIGGVLAVQVKRADPIPEPPPQVDVRIRHELDGSPRPVCGALMKLANERCGRRPGHGYEHRSRYAMDNAALLRRAVTP